MPTKQPLLKIFSILFGVSIALGFGEIALRVIGFEYQLYPSKVQFGWPDPVEMQERYEPDQERLWIPKDYLEKVAQLSETRPSIIFMGDSCTEFGLYDKSFAAITNRELPDEQLNYANLGVGGWSSYQGLQQLRLDVVPLHPKILTIYFGWNDHWISFGIEDKDIGNYSLENPALTVYASKLRLVQLINFFYVRIMLNEIETERKPERVSIADYRKYLTEMVELSLANDILPVLITAPTSHTKGNEPAYLAERWLNDIEELVPIHQQYLQVVREVALDNNIPLLDLAKEFEGLPEKDLKTKLFQMDGIHLQPSGDEKIAEYMYKFFKEERLLERLKN